MCRSIAEAGAAAATRRCPIHHDATMLSVHALSQEFPELTKPQIETEFNSLRKYYEDATPSDESAWTTFLSTVKGRDFSPRFAEIEERLNSHDIPEQGLDQASKNALINIRPQLKMKQKSLNKAVETLANKNNLSYTTARSIYDNILKDVQNNGRRLTENENYTNDAVSFAIRNDLPTDTASIVAFERFKSEVANRRSETPVVTRIPAHGSGGIVEYGYDRESRRLEIVLDGNDTLMAYRNVPESIWEQLTNPLNNPIYVYHNSVLNNANHQYMDLEEGAEAYTLSRCEACGQFTGENHECPEMATLEYRNTMNSDEVIVPVYERDEIEDMTTESSARGRGRPAQGSVVEDEGEVPLFMQIRATMPPSDSDSALDAWLDLNNPNGTYETNPDAEINMLDLQTIRRPRFEIAPDSNRYKIINRDRYREVIGVPANVPQFARTAMIVLIKDNAMYYVREFNRDNYITGSRGVTLIQTGYVDRASYSNRMSTLTELYRSTPYSQIEQVELSFSTAPHRANINIPNISRPYQLWLDLGDHERVVEALESGKIVTSHMQWSGITDTGFIDQYGNDFPTGSFSVSGKYGVIKNGDRYEFATNPGELSCSCEVYRSRNNCHHITYVIQYANEMTKFYVNPKSVIGEHELLGADVSPRILLDPSLSFETDTETGSLVSRQRLNVGGHGYLPGVFNYTPITDLNDPEQVERYVFEYYRNAALDSMRYDYLNTSTVDSTASSGIPTVISTDPYFSSFVTSVDSYNENSYRLVGDLIITKENSGEYKVNGERLRCSCGRYMSAERPCMHVKALTEAMRINANTPRNLETREYDQYSAIPSVENISVDTTKDMMHLYADRTDDTPLEEFANRIQELQEERRRAEEERIARRIAEEQRRLATRIESYRVAIEEDRNHAERERQQWLHSHPEYVAFYNDRNAAWNSEDIDPQYESLEEMRAVVNTLQAEGLNLTVKYENVTDGICAPREDGGGRGFGVEIEVDFDGYYGDDYDDYDDDPYSDPPDNPIQDIIAEMKDLGLTSQDYVNYYHGGAENSWSEWSIERDESVGVEIVSPVLYDQETHWKQIEQVLEIVKRHGGKATRNTGSHVNISSGSSAGNHPVNVETARIVQQHEDVLYRAATDPARRMHRGYHYAAPIPGFVDIEVPAYARDEDALVGGIMNDHFRVVNFGNSRRASESNRVEFRMWDGSLDLATIQRQVATSAAIFDRADLQIHNGNASEPRTSYMRAGENSVENSHEISDAALGNLMEFVNKTFRKREDREEFIKMFLRNNWATQYSHTSYR